MFVAIRYMQHEVNAIAEIVGPFDSGDAADQWMDDHWGELNSDECESYPLTPPTESDQ